MNISEVGFEDANWIELTQDRFPLQDFVNILMFLWVPLQQMNRVFKVRE